MNYLITILISYLIGAIPSAYLWVKIFRKSDITKKGTGNVGAMNTFDVTGSFLLGILVLLSDVGKAYLTLLLIDWLSEGQYLQLLISSLFIVIGHNFSIYLKFKGGRGLATALGISLYIAPIIFLVWIFLWLSAYFIIKKNQHIANVFATFFTPIVIAILPDLFLADMILIYPENIILFKYLVLAICIVIIIKHIKPLLNLASKTTD